MNEINILYNVINGNVDGVHAVSAVPDQGAHGRCWRYTVE